MLNDEIDTNLTDLGGFTPIIDSTTGEITGYKTTAGADTVFPFSKDSFEDLTFTSYRIGNGEWQDQQFEREYDSAPTKVLLVITSCTYPLLTTRSFTTTKFNYIIRSMDPGSGTLSTPSSVSITVRIFWD